MVLPAIMYSLSVFSFNKILVVSREIGIKRSEVSDFGLSIITLPLVWVTAL